MSGRDRLIRWLAAGATLLLLSACGPNSTVQTSDTPSTDTPTSEQPVGDPTPEEPPVVSEAPIAPAVLDAAASFLAAAAGKETPMIVDQVVFVNTVLGLNDLPRQPMSMYGDLWVLNRDAYGVPITHTVEFAGQSFQCEEPLAAVPLPDFALQEDGSCVQQLDADGNPLFLATDIVPMIVEEYMDGSYKCAVDPCYVDYTQEFEIGRLNMVRSSVQNPGTMARAFAEAMKNINAAELVTLDLSGRLVLTSTTQTVNPETGESEALVTATAIDAPRENLALYQALLQYGRLAGYGIATQGEEGQTIPAPWLEVSPAVQLGVNGELEFLRSGTEGRDLDHGVDLIGSYLDLSGSVHDSRGEYQRIGVDFVQYQDPAADPAPACEYVDAHADLWERVLGSREFSGSNIAAFTRHADDARRIILFTHAIIQGLPESGSLVGLPLLEQLQLHDPGQVGELLGVGAPGNHLLLETAAALLGAASGKEAPIGVDTVAFVNSLVGLNDTVQTTDKGDLFGDLWILNRNADGAPILQTIELAGQSFQCVEPLASEPLPVLVAQADGSCLQQLDGDGNPLFLDGNIVPMIVEEYMDGQFKCAVDPCYADYVQELELGRLNMVRTQLTNPNVLNHHLVEAVSELNTASAIKVDLAGRLVYTVPYLDEAGESQTVDRAIDSPMMNLALYGALLKWGKLAGEVNVKIEGKQQLVQLALNPEIDLAGAGLEFLRDGVADLPGIGRHGPGPSAGYADLSWFHHCGEFDYGGVPVDYVQWHDPDANGCSYTGMQEDLWQRVLGGGAGCDGNIAAFARQADQARQVILFTHEIIQGLP